MGMWVTVMCCVTRVMWCDVMWMQWCECKCELQWCDVVCECKWVAVTCCSTGVRPWHVNAMNALVQLQNDIHNTPQHKNTNHIHWAQRSTHPLSCSRSHLCCPHSGSCQPCHPRCPDGCCGCCLIFYQHTHTHNKHSHSISHCHQARRRIKVLLT